MFTFMVFAGLQYYPEGPNDFKGSFKTAEEAEKYAEALRTMTEGFSSRLKFDWVQVWQLDVATGEFEEIR